MKKRNARLQVLVSYFYKNNRKYMLVWIFLKKPRRQWLSLNNQLMVLLFSSYFSWIFFFFGGWNRWWTSITLKITSIADIFIKDEHLPISPLLRNFEIFGHNYYMCNLTICYVVLRTVTSFLLNLWIFRKTDCVELSHHKCL